MSEVEYTPTTDEIRKATKLGSYESWGPGTAYFDRWLAAHDAEVREAVAREIDAWAAEQQADGILTSGAWSDGVGYGIEAARQIARGDSR